VTRAFITGARGFIGRTLAARLRERGVEVRGVDFAADPDVGVVAGDIADPGEWQRHAEGCDLVVHTAAIVSNAFDLDTSWRVNVLGTRRVLDAAVRAGAGRFVHLSSVRAFSDLGFPPGVDESHPVRPDGNPYVDTKIASEQVALQAHAGGEVEVTVIRPADVYGPGSRPWTILPLEAIRAGQFMLPARGRGVFSPVYVENLLDGLLLAAAAPEAAGEVFTLGDGAAVSTRDFFANYFRMLGRRGPLCVPTRVAVAAASVVSLGARARGVPTEVNAATMRYLARRGTYSIEKARRVLGYEPRIELEEGMARTEAWLRAEALL
jgi:nucleoside-diphosphate-sugar epimerase